VIAVVGLWIPAATDLVGIKQMAWFQNVSVVLESLPLIVVGVVGWFFVKAENSGPFTPVLDRCPHRRRHRPHRCDGHHYHPDPADDPGSRVRVGVRSGS
jgi:amino acid transporter